MTVEEYIKYRTGAISVPLIVRNMFTKPFFADSLRSFWHFWNPGYGYFLLFNCYKPLRKVLPSWISLILTFVVCGLFHDILYIVPIILVNGFEFVFPFVTVWFVIITIGILITDKINVNFRSIPKYLRPILHLGYLAFTFYLTRYLDMAIG